MPIQIEIQEVHIVKLPGILVTINQIYIREIAIDAAEIITQPYNSAKYENTSLLLHVTKAVKIRKEDTTKYTPMILMNQLNRLSL